MVLACFYMNKILKLDFYPLIQIEYDVDCYISEAVGLWLAVAGDGLMLCSWRNWLYGEGSPVAGKPSVDRRCLKL